MKNCSKCNNIKPLTEFNRKYNDYASHCKSCSKENSRLWYLKNKDYVKNKVKQYKEANKNKILSKMYNIEENSLKVLIDKSNGICAICKNKVKLFIDHDHINKKFRGLICHKCNTGLGMFCDNVDYLKEAIKYLKKSKK